jgi:hypothetical protein
MPSAKLALSQLLVQHLLHACGTYMYALEENTLQGRIVIAVYCCEQLWLHIKSPARLALVAPCAQAAFEELLARSEKFEILESLLNRFI